MSRRRRKVNYYKLKPIEVYDLVVRGKLLKFPNGYVKKENMKEIIREVILNRLKFTREEICKKVTYTYLKRYRLGGSKRAFGENIYTLISYCFPEMKIKYWELNKVENGYWKVENNRREYMTWLCEKENINTESIYDLKRINARLIQKYAGSKILAEASVYELILLVTKVDVKQWQVTKMNVWTEDKVKEAVKWLIEEKLKWTYDDVVEKISAKTFSNNGLSGMLQKYCNHSPLKALQIAYPNTYYKLKNVRPEYLRKNFKVDS